MPRKTATQVREKSSVHNRKPQTAYRASRQRQELVNPVTVFARTQALPASEINPADILALQRTVGNRAVQQILSAQAFERSSSASRPPVIQAKLTVGPANDHYEQEADRIAGKVTSERVSENGPESIQRQLDEDEPLQRTPIANSITPLIQRQQESDDDEEIQTSAITPLVQRQQETDDDEEIQTSAITPLVQRRQETDDDEEIQTKRSGRDGSFVASAELERRLQSSRAGGSPLPSSLRLPMEHRFGADFGNVRIHTGADASQLNRSLNAKAFTHGSNIYFGEGAYNPASETGRQLLAHELTHVVQQGATRAHQTGVRRKAAVTQSSEKIVQRVVLSPTLSYLSPQTRERLRRLDEERRRRRMNEAPQEEGPGRAARVRQWVAEKKQGAYDPVQARHKPGLVSAGISGTGAVTSTVAGLVSMLPSVSQVAAASGGGSAAGALAAISGPVNVVSGLYNTFKGDSKQQKAEGGLSAVAGLGQTFAGSALAVDSISKLANVASTGTKFLSAAVLPAQIAMSAVDVVRGTYGAAKAIARAKALQRIKNEFRNTRLAHFAEFASQYQGKRKRTAALNTAAGVASLIGGALLLSGVAAPAGIAFLALGGVLKVGSLFGGWLRDKFSSQKAKAKKDEEDRWTLYVDRALSPENVNTEHSRGVLRILSVMGMQRDTINRVIREDDTNKRLAVIRTLIMRR